MIFQYSVGIPELLHVAQYGEFHGKHAAVFNILGRRSGWVNSTDMQDIVPFSSASLLSYSDPEGAAIEIVSTSASDDGSPAGTGAQTVDVVYLDSAGEMQSSTVTMNGTTPVSLGTVAHAIQWAEVSSVGAGMVAAGTITIRNVATPTTIYEQISAGGNRSMSGRFKVPARHSAFIPSWDTHVINADIDLRIRGTTRAIDRALSPVFHFDDNAYMALNSQGEHPLPWLKYPAGSRIKVSGIPASTAGNVRADVSFKVMMITEE